VSIAARLLAGAADLAFVPVNNEGWFSAKSAGSFAFDALFSLSKDASCLSAAEVLSVWGALWSTLNPNFVFNCPPETAEADAET